MTTIQTWTVPGWVASARAAGHPVETVRPGRWRHPDDDTWPRPAPGPDGVWAPNDLLDAVREAASIAIPWAHALMPDAPSAAALCQALLVHVPPPAPTATVPGAPTLAGWDTLVAEEMLRARPFSVEGRVSGRVVHAVDVPAAMLTLPIPAAAERPCPVSAARHYGAAALGLPVAATAVAGWLWLVQELGGIDTSGGMTAAVAGMFAAVVGGTGAVGRRWRR